MGAQGTALVDFGAFPGSVDAVVTITGQSGILSSSLVEAWVIPIVSQDHSVGEHYVDPPLVIAGEIVPGTGFNIRATAYDFDDPTPFGKYTVAWVWN